jgi:hypothetical protein
MATTTNYGWTTPDDTALVKDGAAAIRTLGSSIDTTTKNLNPSTTLGDIEYRSSTPNVNTRLPLGTANQVLRVNSGGTAPEWATTADQTPLTTKGDLFGFDTADARIPVGTNGHVLTADSAQGLGVKWAAPASGALTKISSAPFSAISTIDIDSLFSSTYKRYMLILSYVGSGALELNLRFRYSGTTETSANYYGSGWSIERNNAAISYGQSGATSKKLTNDGSSTNVQVFYFTNVGNSSQKPHFYGNGINGSSQGAFITSGILDVAQTYTGINLFTSTGTITGDYQMYGLEN